MNNREQKPNQPTSNPEIVGGNFADREEDALPKSMRANPFRNFTRVAILLATLMSAVPKPAEAGVRDIGRIVEQAVGIGNDILDESKTIVKEDYEKFKRSLEQRNRNINDNDTDAIISALIDAGEKDIVQTYKKHLYTLNILEPREASNNTDSAKKKAYKIRQLEIEKANKKHEYESTRLDWENKLNQARKKNDESEIDYLEQELANLSTNYQVYLKEYESKTNIINIDHDYEQETGSLDDIDNQKKDEATQREIEKIRIVALAINRRMILTIDEALRSLEQGQTRRHRITGVAKERIRSIDDTMQRRKEEKQRRQEEEQR